MNAFRNAAETKYAVLLKVLASASIAVLVFSAGFVIFLIGIQSIYNGYIYPGVSVGGVDVAEMTPQDAVDRLNTQLSYPETGRILLRYGDKLWVAKPAELGFFLDAEHNAKRAYQVGRRGPVWEWLGEQYHAWRFGFDLTPDFVFSEPLASEFLNKIAPQVELPVREASLKVDGLNVIAVSGQVGRHIDVPATIALLYEQLQLMRDGEVPLMIIQTPPEIMDVSSQAETARRILEKPLTLKIPGAADGDPGPWTFKRKELAKMLTIARVKDDGKAAYRVQLDMSSLRKFLEGIAPTLNKQPENARFIFDDDTRELKLIQAATIGQKLDIDASIAGIQSGLAEGKHTINLDMDYTNPEVTDDATAKSLGITELVSAHTSYFYGSSAGRIQNIRTASAHFHGYLVAPGETFSMAKVLGSVSLENGYTEAWIISGNRTVKGVGGGVCQVSTTLFRTAFFGGYPIVERHPHAYRVYYYEQSRSGGVNTRLAGLDATVYVPVMDLKFKNDTPYWLLMETYVNVAGRSLTWKFYSTSDGRKVDWSTTGLTNRKDPPNPQYIENPKLAKGEIKQVDWAVEGANVTVSRTVYRDGEVLFKDTYVTHYKPWRAVCEYGPGTDGMPPEDPDPDDPCEPDIKRHKGDD